MISLSSQNWSKIKKPVSQSVQWPERRQYHAASHITGPVFVMIGGYQVKNSEVLPNTQSADMWLYTNQWIKVFHKNLVTTTL